MEGTIRGDLSPQAQISGSLSAIAHLTGSLTIPAAVGVETYDGSYEFTPSEEAQAIEIEGKRASSNITINPIPSNYGLITWNGASLTVS